MSYKRPDKRYPKNWNRLRHWVFKRDHYTCQMCGRRLSRRSGSPKSRKPICHHKIPIGMGGSHHSSNLQTLCRRCHRLVHKDWLDSSDE